MCCFHVDAHEQLLMHAQLNELQCLRVIARNSSTVCLLACTHLLGNTQQHGNAWQYNVIYLWLPDRDDVPIVIVMKAMGIESDQEVTQLIGSEGAYTALFAPSLQECKQHAVFSQHQALEWLGKSSTSFSSCCCCWCCLRCRLAYISPRLAYMSLC